MTDYIPVVGLGLGFGAHSTLPQCRCFPPLPVRGSPTTREGCLGTLLVVHSGAALTRPQPAAVPAVADALALRYPTSAHAWILSIIHAIWSIAL